MRTGTVFAATPATTGIAPFMDLMTRVMSQPPYKDAPRVFVIVDNGSDHRGQAAVTRLASPAERHHDPHPGARLLAEPDEIFFIWSLPGAVLNVHDGHLSALAAAS